MDGEDFLAGSNGNAHDLPAKPASNQCALYNTGPVCSPNSSFLPDADAFRVCAYTGTAWWAGAGCLGVRLRHGDDLFEVSQL